jgi:hypothetical protein
MLEEGGGDRLLLCLALLPKLRGEGTRRFVKREMANRCPGYRKPIEGDRLHGQRSNLR